MTRRAVSESRRPAAVVPTNWTIARFQNGSVHFQPGQLFLSHRDVLSRSLSIARHAFPRRPCAPRSLMHSKSFHRSQSLFTRKRGLFLFLSLSVSFVFPLSHAYAPPSLKDNRSPIRFSSSARIPSVRRNSFVP